MGFSRQEHCSERPCPPPGGLPDPGIKPAPPVSPALWADSVPLSHQGSPDNIYIHPPVVGFPSHVGDHRVPSRVPGAIQKVRPERFCSVLQMGDTDPAFHVRTWWAPALREVAAFSLCRCRSWTAGVSAGKRESSAAARPPWGPALGVNVPLGQGRRPTMLGEAGAWWTAC